MAVDDEQQQEEAPEPVEYIDIAIESKDAGDEINIDVQLAATEDEIDSLGQQLDEEIAAEITEPEIAEIKPEDVEEVNSEDTAPALKFESNDAVETESPVSLAPEDPEAVKKKLIGESDEIQIRKEAG